LVNGKIVSQKLFFSFIKLLILFNNWLGIEWNLILEIILWDPFLIKVGFHGKLFKLFWKFLNN
jgi:hypothetical protein